MIGVGDLTLGLVAWGFSLIPLCVLWVPGWSLGRIVHWGCWVLDQMTENGLSALPSGKSCSLEKSEYGMGMPYTNPPIG